MAGVGPNPRPLPSKSWRGESDARTGADCMAVGGSFCCNDEVRPPMVPPLCGGTWIPACAGMTGYVEVSRTGEPICTWPLVQAAVARARFRMTRLRPTAMERLFAWCGDGNGDRDRGACSIVASLTPYGFPNATCLTPCSAHGSVERHFSRGHRSEGDQFLPLLDGAEQQGLPGAGKGGHQARPPARLTARTRDSDATVSAGQGSRHIRKRHRVVTVGVRVAGGTDRHSAFRNRAGGAPVGGPKVAHTCRVAIRHTGP